MAMEASALCSCAVEPPPALRPCAVPPPPAAASCVVAGAMGISGINAKASAPALAEAALDEVATPETTAVRLVFHSPGWDLAGEGCSTGLGTGVLLVAAEPTDLPLAADFSGACTCM